MSQIEINEINSLIENISEKSEISDGDHTFGDLYNHRIALYIALCNVLSKTHSVYKSHLHNDGSGYNGWFLMQLETKEGQISYHLPVDMWEACQFAEELEKAKKWDGHTSDDVLTRLLNIN